MNYTKSKKRGRVVKLYLDHLILIGRETELDIPLKYFQTFNNILDVKPEKMYLKQTRIQVNKINASIP